MSRGFFTYSSFVLLFFVLVAPELSAQIQSQGSGLNPATLDTMRVDTTLSDTTQTTRQKPDISIVPWRYNHSVGAEMATSDSLLRWQTWPDWTFKKNRDPGVLSFRLGTVGRSNSLMIDAHEPRHQELYWEDIPMHSRISGTINWNVMPIHKIESIYEDGEGIIHETDFYLKKYYVNKPLSKLIFDESKFDRRALEFWVTQNFSQKTNLEMSYWDRRGGGGYKNSSFNGNQIFGRVYHQLNNRQFLKLRLLTGKRSLGTPFGYQIPDLGNFAFNRFSTAPIQSGASSESSMNIIGFSYHRRPEDTTEAIPERLRAGIFMNNQKREVSYRADTTYSNVRTLGAYAHKWLEWKPFKVEGEIRYELFVNKERNRSSLAMDNWSLLTAKGNGEFQPFPWVRLLGQAEFQNRDDNYSSYSFGSDLKINIADRLRISGGASRGTVLPTIQQLYWNSIEYSGTPDLNREDIQEIHANATITLFGRLDIGGKGQIKQVQNGIMLNNQQQFVNIDEYNAVSLTAFMDFDSPHVELSASGTIQEYQDATPAATLGVPGFSTTRAWLKGGAYWKGYLFDRATYVKAGVSGMFSPFQYQAEHYDTALDYWQPASIDQELPWYSRLDVDISARVRSIMFVMRFENVLDEVSQLGYFETANYPMPPRRFLFGVRALFNN